jgi:hypothetical protein
MRSLVALGILVLLQCLSGCFKRHPLERLEVQSNETTLLSQPQYVVLREEPNSVLERLATEYPSDFQEFCRLWTETASSVELNGERTVELLEIASFADVTCHPVEYRLRVATLDYIESAIDRPGVVEALQWIKSSYKSGLPHEVPGDDGGQFRGLQVESMNIRMRNYASELLSPQLPSQHRPAK